MSCTFLDMTRTSTNESEPQGLLGFGEAAAWLNVRESWLRREVTARRVPHRRMGRAVRFSVDDLHSIVATSAVTPEVVASDLKPSRRKRSA